MLSFKIMIAIDKGKTRLLNDPSIFELCVRQALAENFTFQIQSKDQMPIKEIIPK